jgi:hypothetical protein
VVATGAGNPSISSNIAITGLQTFNIGTGRTLTLDTGNFIRNVGASLNIQGAGTVSSTQVGLSSADLINGIVGPWAIIGTGTSTQYTTFSGNTLVGLTGTAAADGSNVTSTLGTFNYDLAAVGSLGAGASVNTLRFTGTSGTVAGSLTTNGLMNVSSNGGTLTFSGTITAGSTNELVLMPITGAMTFSGVIQDGGASSKLLVSSTIGSASIPVVNLDNANTYSGGTTISNARLTISNSTALGTGAVTVLKGIPSTTTSAAGGELRLTNNITIANNLSLAGNGLSNSTGGALRNSSGNNTVSGTITIADNPISRSSHE